MYIEYVSTIVSRIPSHFLFWIPIFIIFIPYSPAFQQKFSLVFSPPVGDNLIYMLDTSVQMKGEDIGGKEISLGATASGEISFSIKRVVNDLVFTGLTTPGIQVQAQTLEGPENYSIRTKIGMAVQATFDRRGRATEIHNLEALDRDKVWNISFAQILRDYLPELPRKAVSIGETWQDSKDTMIPYQGMDLEVSIRRAYILQNIIASPYGDVALISVEYEVFLAGEKIMGEWTGSFKGKGTGAGLLNFYIQRNCIQDFKAEYQTEASFSIKKDDKSYQDWPFHLDVSVSFVNLLIH